MVRQSLRAPASAVAVALAGLLVLLGGATGCSHDEASAPQGSTTLEAGGIRWHAIVRGPDRETAPLTVVFLHGASYTSRVWAERGILDRVTGAGFRAVAVDLPGSGATPDSDVAPAEALAALVDVAAPPGRVVVVSPSRSGNFSLALLQERPEVRLAAYVAVAPVGIDAFTRPAGSPPLPALLVWGADDDVIPFTQARQLRAQLPGSRIVVIPRGSHAPYDDEPEAFTRQLLAFLRDNLTAGSR